MYIVFEIFVHVYDVFLSYPPLLQVLLKIL